MKHYKHIFLNIDDLIPYVNNSRTHTPEQINQVCSSIKEFGFTNPVLIDEENGVIAGHCRIQAAKKLNIKDVPCIILDGLTKAQKKAYVIADNQLALNASWDIDLLKIEFDNLKELDFDTDLLGFDDDFLNDLLSDGEVEGLTDEDEVPEIPEASISVLGDIWQLGNHRLMCGDSMSIDAVEKLMDGEKADMVFTDPPYGMKKEKDGVLNDNLNYSDLLEFNKQWIPLTFNALKESGSWYCWGIDEPLMDIYSEIIKPYVARQQATFRNLITWDKGSGQGQNSHIRRCYARADEKCLFIMMGVQGFNNNEDNYFEGWTPILEYLQECCNEAGITRKKLKELCGVDMYDHWFTKSQWTFIPEDHYNKLKKEYGSFNKEYNSLKKEYNKAKDEYYETRAYFNNTHGNFNNVWHFNRHVRDGSEGGHATPKPIELCERALLSSSRKNESVLDVFAGSGSTLIACEKTGRNARLMELDEKYCDVTINRWQNFTGKDAIHTESGKTYNELKNASTDCI